MNKQPTAAEVKNFVYILSGILFIFAVYPLLKTEPVRYWMLFLVLMLLGTVIINSRLLQPLYSKWIAVGEFIGNIISKIVLFILFYFLFTPASLILKLLNKDLLHKTLNTSAGTYWIERESPPGSMKNQF